MRTIGGVDRDEHRHTARVAAVVGALIVSLVTTLSTSLLATDAPLTAGVLVLAAAAVAALVGTTAGGLLGTPPAAWPGARQPVPALASRVADPVRHPVRPRAPGTVAAR
ncbi:hypothetical protein L615_003200000280 [Nocardioides sp. J9]|nr:hypothetical protein L615_003200000280 [Nocardioides sp. J9]